jgi:hypothetical protein
MPTKALQPTAHLRFAPARTRLSLGFRAKAKRRMWHTQQLILHGSIIFLLGLLSGIPFGRAIVHRKPEATVRGWRVAHSGITMGGVLLLALSSVVPHLQLSMSARALLIWAFIVSSYGFAVALPLGAHYGHRGLSSAPPFLNRIVYLGNIIGVVGSLVGAFILLWGASAALYGASLSSANSHVSTSFASASACSRISGIAIDSHHEGRHREWMLADEIENDLLLSFLKVRQIIHGELPY